MSEKLYINVVISKTDQQMCLANSGMTGQVSRPKKLFLKWTKNSDLAKELPHLGRTTSYNIVMENLG